ncbi:MAG: hypothetical protein ACPH9W_10935 [Pseudomonadales bacterium]
MRNIQLIVKSGISGAVGIGLLVIHCSVFAEQDYLLTTFQMPDVERGYVSLDYTYFSESLDVFNYSEKLESTFKPERASSFHGSLSVQVTSRLMISYEREGTSATTSRDREPFRVSSDVVGNSGLIQWQLGEVLGHDAEVFFGYAKRAQDPLSIECYEYSGITVGRCEGADFTFQDPETGLDEPAVVTSADETRWSIGFSMNRAISDRWTLQHTLRYRSSDVSAKVDATILTIEDPFLLGVRINGERLGDTIDQLRQTFPQSRPWTERIVRYDLGLNWSVSDRWMVSNTIGFLSASRSDYEKVSGSEGYNSNWVWNASIWYMPSSQVTTYLRGTLTRHYLLGLDSMLYNQRTAKFFAHPYGQISAGLVFSF